MNWLEEYVGDPLKGLLAKVETGADEVLKELAEQVAATLPAAPISATTETAFTDVIQTGFDALVTDVVGPVPAVGEVMAAEAIKGGNAAIDYAVEKGAAALNALAAAAKAKLASYGEAPAPAANGNPTAAEMGATA